MSVSIAKQVVSFEGVFETPKVAHSGGNRNEGDMHAPYAMIVTGALATAFARILATTLATTRAASTATAVTAGTTDAVWLAMVAWAFAGIVIGNAILRLDRIEIERTAGHTGPKPICIHHTSSLPAA